MRGLSCSACSALLLALVLALAACSGSSSDGIVDDKLLHVASPVWQEQVIYFVMIDRFANGDRTNDDQHKGELDPTAAEKYSGGDLQGIINQLDYIQGLGATALWITPPVANMWWDPLQQSGGYHGYWARHLEKVDEHIGTLETYQALSRALHQRGMYLIQDIVPNHMGNFFQYAGASYDPNDLTKALTKNSAAAPTSKPEQSPFDQNDPTDPAQRAAAIYHFTPAIANYGDAMQEASYAVSDLDDLNTENPVVRKALRKSYAFWIKQVGVDAFRVDTAKFCPHDFWNDFIHSTDADAPGINEVARKTGREDFLSFGEVFESPGPMNDDLERKVASFLGTPAKPELSSVLAFPLYGEIERVFASGLPTSFMTYRLGRMMDPSLYPNPYILPTFVDNHDVRRFVSISSSNGDDLMQALTFLFTVPGIPVVYYGTEQGFSETRQAMFEGGWKATRDRYVTTSGFYQRIKKLSALRRGHKALTHGTLQVLADTVGGAGPFAYKRSDGTETILVLFNTSKLTALASQIDTGLPAGSVLEVLDSQADPAAPLVGEGGRLTAVLPAHAVIVARTTSQVVAPPTPGATITVTSPIAGMTFTSDVVLTGTVSPPTTALQMVLDGNLARATAVTVAGDGTWSVLFPVSKLATGRFDHDLSFYAPGPGVATPQARFTTDVVFSGQTYTFPDAAGDDKGPAGTYTYPSDSTFAHQMDLTGVKLEVGATTMNLHLSLADMTDVWASRNGFDHVYFNIYFSLPGQTGVTFMPKLSAQVPQGFTWTYNQFSGGWDNVMYTSSGATPEAYGATALAPMMIPDKNARTVTFVYDRNKLGLDSWSGVKIYITTWDFDGIGAVFRPLTKDGGQWRMGGGGPPFTPDATDPTVMFSADPKIMDDLPVITIP